MPWGELLLLLRALLADPRSRLRAVVAEWSHPLSREAMQQLDMIDLLLMRWSKDGKFKPVARPWDKKPKAKAKRKPSDAHRKLRPYLYND